MGAKIANARAASQTNDDISSQPSALQDGGRSNAGEGCNAMRRGFTVVNYFLSRLQNNESKELPTLTKFQAVLSARKVMATMFCDMKGVLLAQFQQHGKCSVILLSA